MQHDVQQWSIPDARAVFRLHCQSQRYRPTSIRFNDVRLDQFQTWLAARDITTLSAITSRHIRAFLAERATTASGNYLHGIAQAIRTFCNFCLREEMLTASPMATVAMPKQPDEILPAFTSTDIRKLMRAADDDREKALLHFLLDTGLRATECVNLSVGDVDIAAGRVTVKAGKGEKDRVVYIGATTGRHLLRYLRATGLNERAPLWTNERTGKRLTYFGLAQLVRKLGKRADVAHCNPHTFRRTYALNSLRNGMDIYTLARLMGHATIDVLKKYLALVEYDLEDAAAKFGVVDHL